MINKKFSYKSTQGLPGGANELKKFITGSISVTGYKSDSPDVDNDFNIIPSNRITMEDVEFPVLGIDNLGNEQMMMPGGEYTFPGDYVTELPQMGKGGLTQWFAEDWRDVKTGKKCGRSGKKDKRRSYPACRPSKRVNKTTPKTTKEMSAAEKAKFKREKTSGKRISYNHKRKEDGGEIGWLDTYQDGGETSTFLNPDKIDPVYINYKRTPYEQFIRGIGLGLEFFGLPAFERRKNKKTPSEFPLEYRELPHADMFDTRNKEFYDTKGNQIYDQYEQERMLPAWNFNPEERDAYNTARVWNYYKDYMSSPRYSKMLRDKKDRAAVEIGRAKKLQKISSFPKYEIRPRVGGYYKTSENAITLNPDQATDFLINEVIPHEMSHATDFVVKDGYYIPKEDIEEIKKRVKPSSEINLPEGSINYLSDPSEVRARLNSVRYNLHNKGVDVFNKPIKKEDLNNLDVDGLDDLDELKSIYKEDDLLWLFNNISKTKDLENSSKQVAKYGGWLNKYQNGGETSTEDKSGRLLSAGSLKRQVDQRRKDYKKWYEANREKINKEIDPKYSRENYQFSFPEPEYLYTGDGSSIRPESYTSFGSFRGTPYNETINGQEDVQQFNFVNEPHIDKKTKTFSTAAQEMDHEFGHYAMQKNPEVFLYNLNQLVNTGITDKDSYKDYYSSDPDNFRFPSGRRAEEFISDAYSIREDMRREGMYDFLKGEKLTPELFKKYLRSKQDKKDFISKRFIDAFKGDSSKDQDYKDFYGPLQIPEDNPNLAGLGIMYPNLYSDNKEFYDNLKTFRDSPEFQKLHKEAYNAINKDKLYRNLSESSDRINFNYNTNINDALKGQGYKYINDIFTNPNDIGTYNSPTNYKYDLPPSLRNWIKKYPNQEDNIRSKYFRRSPGNKIFPVKPNNPTEKEYLKTATDFLNSIVKNDNNERMVAKNGGWLEQYQYGGHSVRPGDTFYGIANKYGLGRQDLVQANPNINIDNLKVGQRIALPEQYKGEELIPGYFETKDKSIFRSTVKQPQKTKKSKPSEDPLFTGLSKVQKTRRKELIEAADKVASTQKNSEALNKLLVMTAVMENTLGTDSKAYNRDYTRSPMSIDSIAYQDIFGMRKGARDYTRSQKKAFNWLKDLGYDYKNMDETLKSNDPLASMAAARLYYGRNPKVLPSANDKDAMFDYYMDMYNKGGVDKYKGKAAYKNKWDKFYNDLYGDKKQYGGQTNWLENYK